MIVVDANLLIYAVNEATPNHQQAKEWWESTLNGTETVGLPWVSILAFLRLTTRRGLFANPLSVEQAFELIESWLACDNVRIVEASTKHAGLLRELLLGSGTAANLTTDAHIAVLAIENGAELCSADSDFGRFVGLRWRNPLQPTEKGRA